MLTKFFEFMDRFGNKYIFRIFAIKKFEKNLDRILNSGNKRYNKELILILTKTGTHSDLF